MVSPQLQVAVDVGCRRHRVAVGNTRLMAREAGRIGVTELLVGVPFPSVAMEIMRCATTSQHFEETIFGGATRQPCRISQPPSHVFSRSTPGRSTGCLEPNGAFSSWRAATGWLYRQRSGTCMTVRPFTS